MSGSQKLRTALAGVFDKFERTEVRLEAGSQPGDEFVDVYRYPGRFAGKDWEILAPIQVHDGKVGTVGLGIWSADPGESFEHLCSLADAGRHDVPQPVVAAATEVMERIEASNIHSLVVSNDAQPLLKLLKDIAVAEASGDEDALRAAMDAGRETVALFYKDLDLDGPSNTPAP